MAARRPVAGFRVPAPLVPVVADAVAGALSLPVANPLWRPPPEVAVADPEIVAEDIVVAAWPVELDVAAVELYALAALHHWIFSCCTPNAFGSLAQLL